MCSPLRLLALALLTASAAAQGSRQAPRVVVPIQASIEAGAPRYSVMLTVAGKPVRAGLDTGSGGLHLFARAIGSGPTTQLQPETHYGYGSGLEMNGPELSGEVSLGDLHGSLPFQRIDRIGCPEGRTCPADKLDLDHFGLMGEGRPGAGFDAILGISTGPGNLLAMLGAPRWIVRLPRPGDTRPGELILNPTSAEIGAFQTVSIIPEAQRKAPMQHDAIPACLGEPFQPRAFCGAAILDTGAPGIRVRAPHPPRWSARTPLVLSIGGMTSGFAADGRIPGTHVTTEQAADLPRPRLLLGTFPYLVWAVLYDNEAGTLGFSPLR